ncbi:MAG: CvpA family protein [Acidobacteria bacterium]|nr:CvpA family protein [Acidobacteriota bacterium]
MTFFDLIVFALVGASIIAGALRGLLRALLTLLALVVGLLLAARGYAAAGELLRGIGLIESEAAAQAAGFLLIACGLLLLGFLCGRWVTRGMRRARLEWIDRVLGALFGGLRGLMFCSALYLALTAFPVRIDSVTEARTAPLLAAGARWLSALTSEDLHRRFLESYQELVG